MVLEQKKPDALFGITKFIFSQIGSKNRVVITFLDLTKAFDSVDREKLAKLKAVGLINRVVQELLSKSTPNSILMELIVTVLVLTIGLFRGTLLTLCYFLFI